MSHDETIRLAPYQAVGRNLKARRMANGLSTREVSAALNIEIETLEAYELGIQRAPAEHLFAFASLLDVTIGYLFSAISVDATLLDSQPEHGASARKG